jgi:hypothetical protein
MSFANAMCRGVGESACLLSVPISRREKVLPPPRYDTCLLLHGVKALNSLSFGVKPLERTTRTVRFGGLYPIASATRDDGIAWHGWSMARTPGRSNLNLLDGIQATFKLTHYP